MCVTIIIIGVCVNLANICNIWLNQKNGFNNYEQIKILTSALILYKYNIIVQSAEVLISLKTSGILK